MSATLHSGFALALACGALFASGARAQCPEWEPIGNGPGQYPQDFASFDDGQGSALYVGGNFVQVAGVTVNHVAKWDGARWSALAAGVAGQVWSLCTYDDGTGAALYVGGDFVTASGVAAKHIARWNGTAWSAVGTGSDNGVLEMVVHDDGSGPALYASGDFSYLNGGTYTGVARWNGSSWAPVGTGIHQYHRFVVFDAGGGPQLYACQGGAAFYASIYKWDGSTWTSIASGTSNTWFSDLAVYDRGSGPRLCALWGALSGFPYRQLREYDGANWVNTNIVADGTPQMLSVFDDGSGARLIVSGDFHNIGGAGANYIAAWNGSTWSALAGGVDGQISALGTFDAGHGQSLCVGGVFLNADGMPSPRFAIWRGCLPSPPTPYCTSTVTSGACIPSISASGVPSASGTGSFDITVASTDAQRFGLVFYGVSGPTVAPWGSGSMCVRAPTQRTASQNSGGTLGQCDGALVLAFNSFVASSPGALGQPFAVGDAVWAQGWFRDPPSTKTSAMSNALRFSLTP